jgi:hypothetical protein
MVDGWNEDVDDYKIAWDYEVPEEFLKFLGWACRPSKGVMYGMKNIEMFKAKLFEFSKSAAGTVTRSCARL